MLARELFMHAKCSDWKTNTWLTQIANKPQLCGEGDGIGSRAASRCGWIYMRQTDAAAWLV